jgi:hypothetical protein
MRVTKNALVIGTAVLLTTAAFTPKKTFASFFNKPLIEATASKNSQAQQDTAKTVILPLSVIKNGDSFNTQNSPDESGKAYSLSSLDVSPEIYMKAARKGSMDDIDMKDFVGAYNVSGLKILVLKFGAIAVRDGSNSRDQIVDLWPSSVEIKKVKVTPYGQGKDKWAVITLTKTDGTETKLVLFIDNKLQKLLREFDTNKDPV